MSKEVKLLVDGREVKLTDEQVKILFPNQEKKKSPFDRVKRGGYYYIDESGLVCQNTENWIAPDYSEHRNYNLHFVANYCIDKKLMKQRALHETLNRLLWRFSCENGELENEWDNQTYHYAIAYDYPSNGFHYLLSQGVKRNGCIYFPSQEIADRAVEKIIKPFMKANPDFVW